MVHFSSLLTVAEVASLLQLNTLTVYDYIRSGKLAAIKLGRNYRVSREDLEEFLVRHKTHEEVEL